MFPWIAVIRPTKKGSAECTSKAAPFALGKGSKEYTEKAAPFAAPSRSYCVMSQKACSIWSERRSIPCVTVNALKTSWPKHLPSKPAGGALVGTDFSGTYCTFPSYPLRYCRDHQWLKSCKNGKEIEDYTSVLSMSVRRVSAALAVAWIPSGSRLRCPGGAYDRPVSLI